MPRTYAQLVTRSASLATPFGLEWATVLFGAEAIASLPVRLAGKHRGAPKGHVIWRKAHTPGWCSEVGTPLAYGTIADAWIGGSSQTPRGDALTGQWLGRVQPLAASASAGHFFAAGRIRHATEEAQRAADWEAEKREMRA
jgi:hypothetical protein